MIKKTLIFNNFSFENFLVKPIILRKKERFLSRYSVPLSQISSSLVSSLCLRAGGGERGCRGIARADAAPSF